MCVDSNVDEEGVEDEGRCGRNVVVEKKDEVSIVCSV